MLVTETLSDAGDTHELGKLKRGSHRTSAHCRLKIILENLHYEDHEDDG
jgi:hypothetical protein